MELIQRKNPECNRIQVKDYTALKKFCKNLKQHLLLQGEILEDVSFETKARLYHDTKTDAFQLELIDCLGEEPLEVWMITVHPIGKENTKMVYTEKNMSELFPKVQDIATH